MRKVCVFLVVALLVFAAATPFVAAQAKARSPSLQRWGGSRSLTP